MILTNPLSDTLNEKMVLLTDCGTNIIHDASGFLGRVALLARAWMEVLNKEVLDDKARRLHFVLYWVWGIVHYCMILYRTTCCIKGSFISSVGMGTCGGINDICGIQTVMGRTKPSSLYSL